MNKTYRRKVKRAFTLVELVVVIAIIGILTAVSVAGYIGYTDNANKTVAKQKLSEVKKLLQAYSLVQDSSVDYRDNIDGFVEFCYMNGIDSNSINYYYANGIVSANNSKDDKKLLNEGSVSGTVVFIVKTDSPYYVSFNSGVYLSNGQYQIGSTSNADAIKKGFEKASESALTGYIPKTLNVAPTSFWEYIVSDSSFVKTDKIEIEVQNNGVKIDSITSRSGKYLKKGDLDRLVPNSNIYISESQFDGSYYNEDEKLYYFSTNKTEWMVNGTPFDFSQPLPQGDIVINSAITAAEISNFDTVATIERYNLNVTKRFTEKYDDEVDYENSTRSYYHFDSFKAASDYASYYDQKKRIDTYEVINTGDSCNPVYEISSTPKSQEYVMNESVYDTITLSKSTVLSESATINPEVTLLLPVHDNLEYYQYMNEFNNSTPEAGLDDLPSIDLKITNGAVLNVNGKVVIGSELSTNSGATKINCIKKGFEFCQITIDFDSELILKNGSSISSYGRIIGEGKIHAESGSVINERLAIDDWRGGGNLYGSATNGVFPFLQYHMSDNAVATQIDYGARYVLHGLVNDGNLTSYPISVDFISEKGMFNLKGGSVIKQSDFTTQQTSFTFNGGFTDSQITIDAMGKSFSSDNFSFPLTNIDIVLDGTTSYDLINGNYKVMPGSSITLSKDSTINFSAKACAFKEFGYLDSWASAAFPKNKDAGYIEIAGTLNMSNDSILSGNIKVLPTAKIHLSDVTDANFKYEIHEGYQQGMSASWTPVPGKDQDPIFVTAEFHITEAIADLSSVFEDLNLTWSVEANEYITITDGLISRTDTPASENMEITITGTNSSYSLTLIYHITATTV